MDEAARRCALVAEHAARTEEPAQAQAAAHAASASHTHALAQHIADAALNTPHTSCAASAGPARTARIQCRAPLLPACLPARNMHAVEVGGTVSTFGQQVSAELGAGPHAACHTRRPDTPCTPRTPCLPALQILSTRPTNERTKFGSSGAPGSRESRVLHLPASHM